jgi:hypothetical protein
MKANGSPVPFDSAHRLVPILVGLALAEVVAPVVAPPLPAIEPRRSYPIGRPLDDLPSDWGTSNRVIRRRPGKRAV